MTDSFRGQDDLDPRSSLFVTQEVAGEEETMQSYLVQVSYTPEAWAAMVKDPQNRLEAVRPAVEKLGGKFDHAWLAFGDYDLIGIIHMPENVDAAAFAISVAAGGGCKAFKTTPLLGLEEGIEAMRRAQGSGYRRPG